MVVMLATSFYSEFELYKGITDINAFIEAVKNLDTSKYNIIGCQDDILTADAIKQADRILFIDDIFEGDFI